VKLGHAALLAALATAEASGDTTDVVARASDLAFATQRLGRAILAMEERR